MLFDLPPSEIIEFEEDFSMLLLFKFELLTLRLSDLDDLD